MMKFISVFVFVLLFLFAEPIARLIIGNLTGGNSAADITSVIRCISFAIFLTLVLMGIRKKMHYISRLCEEISILKGGSLDYEITVKGSDELAMLAEEIDNMRLVFKELMKKENE